MKDLIKKLLRENLFDKIGITPEKEVFSAYNGRYIFNVDLAYELINNKQVHFDIKKYSVYALKQYSHPEFSYVDPKKLNKLKKSLNYDNPLGILVRFLNPDDNQPEWVLIDGNHRVRAAAENNTPALLYVITKPEDVEKFMVVDNSIPHELFPDDV
jgi:hypothetical protein